MMRFLLDEMLSPAIARQLRKRGIDAVAVAERHDFLGASDDEVLEVAAAEGRTVVTMNICDFVRLDSEWSAQGREDSGILLVSAARFPHDASLIGALTNALATKARAKVAPSSSYDFL